MSALKIPRMGFALVCYRGASIRHHIPGRTFRSKISAYCDHRQGHGNRTEESSFLLLDGRDGPGRRGPQLESRVWRPSGVSSAWPDSSIGLSGADEKRILGSLKPGAVVSVEGIRAKDGTYWISFKFLSDDQGKTIVDMRVLPAR
jgi:hypothetical protein